MTLASVAGSACRTSLIRYGRSWGVWLLLLVAPAGARLFIPRDDGTAVAISIGGELPVMTSPVIGVCLGLVVSTLLLPAAYIYLRANVNRSQPWQIEEVTPASRVAITLGRYAADVTILLAALLALTIAGLFLAWLTLPDGSLDPGELTLALWVVAGPSLMVVAAVRTLFEALPLLRGGLGDFAYLVVWMTTLGSPDIGDVRTGFLANLSDPVGFVRPLLYGSGLEDPFFAMGSAPADAGRIPVDAMAGIASPGYLESRAAWALIAVLAVVLAGLIHRPRRRRRTPAFAARLTTFLGSGTPPQASQRLIVAGPAELPWLGLLSSQFTLIGGGRPRRLAALLIVLAGLAAGWDGLGLPLATLWLVFAVSEHAGRTEARGLGPLRSTVASSSAARRLAFAGAGILWGVSLAAPHAIFHFEPWAIVTAGCLAGGASACATVLAAFSGSSFAPRLFLLIAWYVHFAA